MEGSQVEMLEVMSLWRKHKGGEVRWMPLPHLNIAHHSSEDFLKTLSTCCLGTGKKRKITVHTWEETHTHTHRKTHPGRVIKRKSYTGDGPLSEILQARTHTHPAVYICAHLQGKIPASTLAKPSFTKLTVSSRLNVLQACIWLHGWSI